MKNNNKLRGKTLFNVKHYLKLKKARQHHTSWWRDTDQKNRTENLTAHPHRYAQLTLTKTKAIQRRNIITFSKKGAGQPGKP